ncbi:hypothetical protein [Paenibacillus sp. DMB5]|uniref:hypothetical protein n=1 Tax=Paenibacillus sp. DMB5 TaxID=1780103 RepID=UPI00076C2BF2|nr:hypothetical protein [Paenibacillus sp. DMB5]KUP24998.1 hypothetical protein AWJ19_03255 [Paenibacillus sp. DMB5]
MTNDELLEEVKAGLTDVGTHNNATLMPKVLAAKAYMLNAGVSLAQLESDLGIATLTIGVSDLWNINSGEVAFSPAFTDMLLPQLMAVSIGE